jgi:hypothetical protein
MAPGPGGGRIAAVDDVAEALSSTWEVVVGAIPGAWCERRGGAIAAVTGADVANLNGVWVYSASADPDVVGSLLDRVDDTGLPYCLQVRPTALPVLVASADKRTSVRSEDVPLMVLDDPKTLDSVPDPPELVLRQLAPDEAELHVLTAAAGFGSPERVFRHVVTPATLSLPGVRCYLGEAEGYPVTTCIGVSLREAVGIFNVATPPGHRARGYGAAVTARAVRDGLASGGRFAFLQSSPEGFDVYQRMGFRTLEHWPSWVSEPEAAPRTTR